jgi:hypothetical protein
MGVRFVLTRRGEKRISERLVVFRLTGLSHMNVGDVAVDNAEIMAYEVPKLASGFSFRDVNQSIVPAVHRSHDEFS